MRTEKDYKKISHTCRARKENKLGKSVRNDKVKTVLSTEWNLKTSKATSFLWKILHYQDGSWRYARVRTLAETCVAAFRKITADFYQFDHLPKLHAFFKLSHLKIVDLTSGYSSTEN